VRIRYSISHGAEVARAWPNVRWTSSRSSGCTASRAPLLLSDFSRLKPVSSDHRSFTHSRRPWASQVQMIWGSALASFRYSTSLLDALDSIIIVKAVSISVLGKVRQEIGLH